MTQRKYNEELKTEVINTIVESGRSVAEVARDYDIPSNTVYPWVERYKRSQDISCLKKPEETPEQEIARLKKELHRAKMERDILIFWVPGVLA
jgi:transposase